MGVPRKESLADVKSQNKKDNLPFNLVFMRYWTSERPFNPSRFEIHKTTNINCTLDRKFKGGLIGNINRIPKSVY